MSALPCIKPKLYVQLSVDGKPCGHPTRILWKAKPGPHQGPDRPYAWNVTEVSEEVTVKFLAFLLWVKPFRVVADLLNLGILASADQVVPLETAFEVLRRHGYTIEEA